MKRSTERILTTHTGSLPRPPELVAMLEGKEDGVPYDQKEFDELVRSSVADVVKLQVEAGIDIVSDGEQGKPSFATYVKDRLSGFDGVNSERRVFGDRLAFPEWNATTTPSKLMTAARPLCTNELGWRDRGAVTTDIENFRAALSNSPAEDAFLPSASLGIIAEIIFNEHYSSEEAYLYALADAMKVEYEAIVNAGFVLQIDAPDAAMGRHAQFWDKSLDDFRSALALRIEAQNHALANIPEEQIRFHLCWGKAGAYSIEASNPRHAHEWQVWQETKLPEGKTLIPGVIDTTTNFVEHPEVVAERLMRFANLLGKENVIAGTDCGYGTSAGLARVHPTVMWAKFRTQVEGAKLASERLWA